MCVCVCVGGRGNSHWLITATLQNIVVQTNLDLGIQHPNALVLASKY